ncbi:hypothetical protein [Anaplasma phagocytophilum]|nr:hypothetical protein [Anaplasma phagocytophilum]
MVWHVESPLVSENYMLGLERYVLCSLPNIAGSLTSTLIVGKGYICMRFGCMIYGELRKVDRASC